MIKRSNPASRGRYQAGLILRMLLSLSVLGLGQLAIELTLRRE